MGRWICARKTIRYVEPQRWADLTDSVLGVSFHARLCKGVFATSPHTLFEYKTIRFPKPSKW